MWVFGLAAEMVWWQWFLMVLGGGFCWGLGNLLAGKLGSRIKG
jgi:hypothetical protein